MKSGGYARMSCKFAKLYFHNNEEMTMLKKRIVAASIAAMLTAPAFAGSLGEWVVDGQALFEVWGDTQQQIHSGVSGNDKKFLDEQVFTLHEIGLGSTKSLGGGNRITWHLFTRVQNGNRQTNGGNPPSNGLGNREAWVGFEGDSWGQFAAGQMMTQAFQVVNWPYACDAGMCEINAEVPGHALTVGNALRYSTPAMGPFNGTLLYGFEGEGFNAAGEGKRPNYLELSGHIETQPVKFDVIYTVANNSGLIGPNATVDNGGPSGADTKDTELFLGTRIKAGPGMEAVVGYTMKKFTDDNGVDGDFWMKANDWALTGTEIKQNVLLLQGKFSFGSNLIGVGLTRYFKSKDDGGTNDDQGTIYGAKWNIAPARGVNTYVFVRHYILDGAHRPAFTAPWQYGGQDQPQWGFTGHNDVTRFGIGGQLLY